MWVSSSRAPLEPMPARGGPTSRRPMSPYLWQMAQAAVKTMRPLATLPAFVTSGISFAMRSSFCPASGLSFSSTLVAALATPRFGWVRRRARLPGPTSFVVRFPLRSASSKAWEASGRRMICSNTVGDWVALKAATRTASASLPGAAPSAAVRALRRAGEVPGSRSRSATAASAGWRDDVRLSRLAASSARRASGWARSTRSRCIWRTTGSAAAASWPVRSHLATSCRAAATVAESASRRWSSREVAASTTAGTASCEARPRSRATLTGAAAAGAFAAA